MVDAKNLIWLDLEMSGLAPSHNVILEMATVITDGELNELAQGPVIAIHQPAEVRLPPWTIGASSNMAVQGFWKGSEKAATPTGRQRC